MDGTVTLMGQWGIESEGLPEPMIASMGPVLDAGFKYVLFSSLLGVDSHFHSNFSKGLKPPTRA